MFNYKTKILDSLGKVQYNLKLFIDPKDIIHQVSFEAFGEDYSSLYDEVCLGKRIDKIDWELLSLVPKANWFLFLLQKIKDDLNGHFEQTFLTVKRISQEDLVCRCFGVTRQDIEKVKPLKMKEVLETTKAGAACGSCLSKIQYLLASDISRDFYFQQRPQSYWIQLYLNQIEQFLSSYNLDQSPLELISFDQGIFGVRILHKENAKLFMENSSLQFFERI